MPKRKKRASAVKKRKGDSLDDVSECESLAERPPSAKKVAPASSTSNLEDEMDHNSSFTSLPIMNSVKLGTAETASSHFLCNYCEFSVESKELLVAHTRQHMIKCPHCSFSSLSRIDVSRHCKYEHDQELEANPQEVDSSSTECEMDKDPCSACVFCSFMTYSTEHLEKHCALKHPGMLAKSFAKMISKQGSAEIRRDDALFYLSKSGFSSPPIEAPASTIVIDPPGCKSDVSSLDLIKPEIKFMPDSNSSAFHSPKPYIQPVPPSAEPSKIGINVKQKIETRQPVATPVKVETLYCFTCPYSNVLVEKLKCHTIVQHPVSAAVATYNSEGEYMEAQDVSFFCVKQDCGFNSVDCYVYQRHLLDCCSHQNPLMISEKERLKSTLTFILDHGSKYHLPMFEGFSDFASLFLGLPPQGSMHTVSSTTHVEFSPLTHSRNMNFASNPQISAGSGSSIMPVGESFNQHQNLPMSAQGSQPCQIQTSFPSNMQGTLPSRILGATSQLQETLSTSSLKSANSSNINVAIHQPQLPVESDNFCSGANYQSHFMSSQSAQKTQTVVANNSADLSISVVSQSGQSSNGQAYYHQSQATYPQPVLPVAAGYHENKSFGWSAPGQMEPSLSLSTINTGTSYQNQQSQYQNQQAQGPACSFIQENTTILANQASGSNFPMAQPVQPDQMSRPSQNIMYPPAQVSTSANFSENSSANFNPHVNRRLSTSVGNIIAGQGNIEETFVGQPMQTFNTTNMDYSNIVSQQPDKMIDMLSDSYSIFLSEDFESDDQSQDADESSDQLQAQQSSLYPSVSGNMNETTGLHTGHQSFPQIQPSLSNQYRPEETKIQQSNAINTTTQFIPSPSPTGQPTLITSKGGVHSGMHSSQGSVSYGVPQNQVVPDRQSAGKFQRTGQPCQPQPSYGQHTQSQASFGQYTQSQPPHGQEAQSKPPHGQHARSNPPHDQAQIQPSPDQQAQIQPSHDQHVQSQQPRGQQAQSQRSHGQQAQIQASYGQHAQPQQPHGQHTQPQQPHRQNVQSQQPNGQQARIQQPHVQHAQSQPPHGHHAQSQQSYDQQANTQQPLGQHAQSQPAFSQHVTSFNQQCLPQLSYSQPDQPQNVPNFLVTQKSAAPESSGMRAASAHMLNDSNQNAAVSQEEPFTPPRNASNPAFNKGAGAASPLSPSIYLSGSGSGQRQVSRADPNMRPRGALALSFSGQRPPSFPGIHSQGNQRPPVMAKRGNPRGRRMTTGVPRMPMQRPTYNRSTNSGDNDDDDCDDVVVTAVTRVRPSLNPHSQRFSDVRRPPLRGNFQIAGLRGRGRGGPAQLHPRGGVPSLRMPCPATQVGQPPKHFDISKHFEDLACAVNPSTEEGEIDDIEIVCVTPGKEKMNQPKAVDASKFSYCCVHCGKNQGSKQVMKQHMKVQHNDTILGAFTNTESGQLLFFCPKLACEFMTYDEGRLCEHLSKCYDLDKAKTLDMAASIRNLKSLKIRQLDMRPSGRSHENPIDLEGQTMKDNFSTSLNDAFGDIVVNASGRHILKNATPPRVSQASPIISPSAISTTGARGGTRGWSSPGGPRFPQQGAGPPSRMFRPRNLFQQQSPHGAGGNIRQFPPRMRMESRNIREVRPHFPSQQIQHHPMPHSAQTQPVVRTPHVAGKDKRDAVVIIIDADSPERMDEEIEESIGNKNTEVSDSAWHLPMATAETYDASNSDKARPELVSMSENTRNRESPTTCTNNQSYAYNSNFSSRKTISTLSKGSFVNTNSPGCEAGTGLTGPSLLNNDGFNNPGPLVSKYQGPQFVRDSHALSSSSDVTMLNQSHTETPESKNTVLNSAESVHDPSTRSESSPLVSAQSMEYFDEEERINSIVLDKVFAKVPDMPKNLSRRLVAKFKAYANYRGVQITTDSKVIDEFVSKISYKGSASVSKSQPSPNSTILPAESSENIPSQSSSLESVIETSAFHSSETSFKEADHIIPEERNRVSCVEQHPSNQGLHKQEPSTEESGQLGHNVTQTIRSNCSPAISCLTPNSMLIKPDREGGVGHDYGQDTRHNDSPNDSLEASVDREYPNNLRTSYGRETPIETLETSDDRGSLNNTWDENDKGSPNNTWETNSDNKPLNTTWEANDKRESIKNTWEENDKRESIKNTWEENDKRESINNTWKDNENRELSPNITSGTKTKTQGSWSKQKDVTDSKNFQLLESDNLYPSKTGEHFLVQSTKNRLVAEVTKSETSGLQSADDGTRVADNPKLNAQESPAATTDVDMALKVEPEISFPPVASTEGAPILISSSIDEVVAENPDLEVDIAGKPLKEEDFDEEMAQDYESFNKEVCRDPFPANKINATVDEKIVTKTKHKKYGLIRDKILDNVDIIDRTTGKLMLQKRKKGRPRTPVTKEKTKGDKECSVDEEHYVRRSSRSHKPIKNIENETREIDGLLSDENEYLEEEEDYEFETDSDSEWSGGDTEHPQRKRIRKTPPPPDPTALDSAAKGQFKCWTCSKILTRCFFAKSHMVQKHPNTGLCALDMEKTVEVKAAQLLIFCPRKCKYVTLSLEGMKNHMDSCSQAPFQEEVPLEDVHKQFLDTKFIELQALTLEEVMNLGKQKKPKKDPVAKVAKVKKSKSLSVDRPLAAAGVIIPHSNSLAGHQSSHHQPVNTETFSPQSPGDKVPPNLAGSINTPVRSQMSQPKTPNSKTPKQSWQNTNQPLQSTNQPWQGKVDVSQPARCIRPAISEKLKSLKIYLPDVQDQQFPSYVRSGLPPLKPVVRDGGQTQVRPIKLVNREIDQTYVLGTSGSVPRPPHISANIPSSSQKQLLTSGSVPQPHNSAPPGTTQSFNSTPRTITQSYNPMSPSMTQSCNSTPRTITQSYNPMSPSMTQSYNSTPRTITQSYNPNSPSITQSYNPMSPNMTQSCNSTPRSMTKSYNPTSPGVTQSYNPTSPSITQSYNPTSPSITQSYNPTSPSIHRSFNPSSMTQSYNSTLPNRLSAQADRSHWSSESDTDYTVEDNGTIIL